MEQDWKCPHCGQKIGTLNITPSAAANQLPIQAFNPPLNAGQSRVIPVTLDSFPRPTIDHK